jgi:hypothetical protein
MAVQSISMTMFLEPFKAAAADGAFFSYLPSASSSPQTAAFCRLV